MAEGRMLKKKVSVDCRWADLANDTHRLLFIVGIAHLDIEGRISGDPREFKAAVGPMLGHITKEVVLEFFEDAGKLGLIQRYQANGRWVVQYPGFRKNQTLRADKEAPSRYPPPPSDVPSPECNSGTTPGELPEDSGTTPAKGKIREDKLNEGNIKEEGEPESSPPADGKAARRSPPFTANDLGKIWNEKAHTILSRVTLPLGDSRAKKIKPFIKAHQDMTYWQALFKKVGNVPFLRGVNDRGWRANFDFVIKNHQEILEGKYDGNQDSRAEGTGPGRIPRGYDQRPDHHVIEVPD